MPYRRGGIVQTRLMTLPPDTYVLRRVPRAAGSGRTIDYAAELNEAQLHAVLAGDGPVLIIAGAGTGKTRTLVYRVARLVEDGTDPGSILLLTFTRKAAAEMLRRASLLLDGRCESVVGGTFHSFANATLRRFGRPLGLEPNFTILDRGDSEDVIQVLRTAAGLDARDRRFPRKQGIASLLSMAVNKAMSVESLIEAEYTHLAEHTPELVALGESYRAYKRERQLVDYDDLLVLLLELLRDHPEARRQLSGRHQHILVDEYQDTNPHQADIVRLLASEHDNVVAVGDDAQSIYAFRGANFRNIMDFPLRFPGTRIVALEENYRSSQAILDLTNAIIARARERHDKTLFTRRGRGQVPALVVGPNEAYQSHFVCQRVLELREEGVPLSEIAVLVRSGFHSFALEIELARADIPFVKRGGIKFVETAHVKDVTAHVRVVLNPRDSVAWSRILMLLEGIGPRTCEDILDWLHVADDPLLRVAEFPRPALATDLQALSALLLRLRDPQLNPAGMVESILAYYDPILRRVHVDDHPRRRQDLEQFAAMAQRYTEPGRFLADMALEPPAESVRDVVASADDGEERLVVSTIHSAKGLEWHSVFVLWVAEGRFPSQYSTDDDAIEEERRLMYVATTRARDYLYLSYPLNMFDRQQGTIIGKPSRFIAGMPKDVLWPIVLVDDLGRG